MPHYSQSSEDKLETATYNLQRLFRIVIEFFDNTIIQGWRSTTEQHYLYTIGASKVQHGKHNETPSQAIDSAPYLSGRGIPWPETPTDWTNKEQRQNYIKDLSQFYYYGGFVMGVAANEGIDIRWGGDWSRDHDVTDQSFMDLVHFEEVIQETTEV